MSTPPKSYAERIYDASKLTGVDRIHALRLLLMVEPVAKAANAADDGGEHERMHKAIDSIINRACYTAPEILAETCWGPLMFALLDDATRAAAEAALEATR